MLTNRRYLHQRALTRPVYQRLEEENLHAFGGHDHSELPVVVTHPQGGGMRPSMPMWLLSQSRRSPAPPDVWAHSAYPPDREERNMSSARRNNRVVTVVGTMTPNLRDIKIQGV